MAARTCGIYRSKDPISNFKIKVRLEKHVMTRTIPLPNVTSQDSLGNMELKDLGTTNDPGAEVEERMIGWQEKLFSQQEFETYSIEGNCHSVQQIKYHQMINDKKLSRPVTKWLFSYVEGDDVPLKQSVTTSCAETPTFLASRVDGLRQRKASTLKTFWDRDGGRIFSKINAVNYHPTRVQQKLWHSALTPKQTMLIMADLGSNERNGQGCPVTLCSIQVDECGVIYVEPDFSSETYELDVKDFGKEIYSFTFEHASQRIGEMERQEEEHFNSSLYVRRAAHLRTLVGLDFGMAPVDTFRLHVFGEIVSAEDFEYDNLYVNFFVENSPDWDVGGPPHASTQTCWTKGLGNAKVAYFCYPFEYHMSCKTKYLFTHENTKWPQLLFQVMSRDAWNRFRTEGYGYISIPYVPGCHVFNVSTWRPLTHSPTDRLRTYFIGGSPAHYEVLPAAHQSKILSKYGMFTETSGTVTVRLQVVLQSTVAQYGSAMSDVRNVGSEPQSSTVLQTSIAAVIEAFHRARQRMLCARESLDI